MWRLPSGLAKEYLKFRYRPEVRLESLEKALATGEKVILTPHYASYLDPVLFGIFAPGSPMVAISPTLARQKWFERYKDAFRHVVIDLNDPFALKRLDELIEKERYVVVLPEPEPTTSGLLMKLSDAVLAAATRSGALVVPARACNTQFTKYSRMGGRLVCARAPKVTLISGEAQKFDTSDTVEKGADIKEQRYYDHLKLEQMMMDTMMAGIWDRKPLFDTLLEQRRLWGGKHRVAYEPDGTTVDWNGMITRIFILQRIVESLSERDERIGIMLPNTVMTLAAIIGTQHADREPAMINYSMGSRALLAACGIAGVKKILTSRRFVDEGKFQPLVDALMGGDLEIFYLEDLVAKLTGAQKLGCLLSALTAGPTPDAEKYAERTAVVLFTSGSEGTPKPVALSHLNIQANTAQVRTVLDFWKTDTMIAIMPMFHSFGLSTGVIMPLSTGMGIAFYPTPLHYKKIPQYAYETKGTVLLGTNAFLAGYAKNADAFDFFEMRYVVCGGDKLKEPTSQLWMQKFGIRVLEGYGVTEGSPVVSVNRMGRCHPGSIGRPLPCIETSITPVEGVHEGGRLVIKGPNVMRGYIQADGSILPPPESGYDTGDIVIIDDENYITIQGRAKRFAKIAGEMVSLTHVEEVVQEVWPDDASAVVSIPDDTRGEVIMLLTERPNPSREELRAGLTARGLPELAIPKKVIPVEVIPRIGAGKTDYTAAVKIAEEQV